MYFSTEAGHNLNLIKNLFSLYEPLNDLIHRLVENKLQILTFSCILKNVLYIHMYSMCFNSHMNQINSTKIIYDWEIQMNEIQVNENQVGKYIKFS